MMTGDVILSLAGTQQVGGNDAGEPIEIVVPARYYKKNGRHYLVFEEKTEGFSEATQNLVQFTEDRLSVHKRGLVNVEMLFEEGKKTNACYRTPMGMMDLDITATGFSLQEEEDEVDYAVAYALNAGTFAADCRILFRIRAKDGGTFRLADD